MEKNTSLKIFLVDDDLFSLHLYEQHLRNLGYADIHAFDNGTGCLNELIHQPNVIFLDYSMKILNGLEVLNKIKRFDPNIHVVFISGQEDISTAVSSLKYGAFDYIVKDDKALQQIEKVLTKIHDISKLLEKRSKGIFKRIFML